MRLGARAGALLIAGTLALASCDAAQAPRLDAQWHRQALLEGELARWLAVAPGADGFLRTVVNRAWQRKDESRVDLTMQARLIYAFASGFELTGEARYGDAARKVADFLLTRFRDGEQGGLYRIVGVNGVVYGNSKHTHGQAFAILALAQLYRATHDERYRDAALGVWRDVDAHLRDAHGGFVIETARNFAASPDASRSLNPVMHLFEAMLALYEASGSSEARDAAQAAGDVIAYKLLVGTPDGGAYVPEWYSEAWQALPKDRGGLIELGHQWELPYLFHRASERGLRAIYAPVAERLLKYAIATSYDETKGGSFNVIYLGGELDRSKGWWQQSECLRTLMHFAAVERRQEMWRRYEQTLQLVRDEFIDGEAGGWRLRPRSVCARSPCPYEQPVRTT